MFSRSLVVCALSCFLSSPLWAGSAWAPGVSKDSGWIDVNKAWNPYSSSDITALGNDAYSDLNLCWAAQSSNMLQYWQNAYVAAGNTLSAGTPDGYVAGRENATRRQYQIFDYFVNNWTDAGGNAYYGIPWYMTGEFPQEYPTEDGWSQRQEGATGTGGFFTNVYSDADSMVGWQYDYNTQDWAQTGDFRTYQYASEASYYTYADYSGFSSLLINAFDDSEAVVGMSITFYDSDGNPTGGHALTVWGCDFDENGFVTRIYLTDSDDGQVALRDFEVTDDGENGIVLSGYNSQTSRIDEISMLSVSKFTPIPEPSTFGLFAGFAALAFVGTRRRIRK